MGNLTQTMPNPPESSGIRDNHYCGSVGEFLKTHIQNNSRLSVVSAYFSIYGYKALRGRLVPLKQLQNFFYKLAWQPRGIE
jgi:hypothetical protein